MRLHPDLPGYQGMVDVTAHLLSPRDYLKHRSRCCGTLISYNPITKDYMCCNANCRKTSDNLDEIAYAPPFLT